MKDLKLNQYYCESCHNISDGNVKIKTDRKAVNDNERAVIESDKRMGERRAKLRKEYKEYTENFNEIEYEFFGLFRKKIELLSYSDWLRECKGNRYDIDLLWYMSDVDLLPTRYTQCPVCRHRHYIE